MIVTLDASVEANVPVTSVVVYEDRAEVSRTVAAVLEGAGTHQIVVEGLSRHVLGSSGTFFRASWRQIRVYTVPGVSMAELGVENWGERGQRGV